MLKVVFVILIITCLLSCGVNGFVPSWSRSSVSGPLTVDGHRVLDANGKSVRFNCVNWSGGHMKDYVVSGLNLQSIDYIAELIKGPGFNCIRYQWSLELMRLNPIVREEALKGEPKLIGKRALEILEYIVNRLTNEHGIMVILDNHVSYADWCCSTDDGNGLWFNDDYSEDYFVECWQEMARMFTSNPLVIGCELRNELRPATVGWREIMPHWNTDDSYLNWARAAKKTGDAIHRINPNLLILVGVSMSSASIEELEVCTLNLEIPNRVVYVVHEYQWLHLLNWDHLYILSRLNPTDKSLDYAWTDFNAELDSRFGILSQQYPVWISEIGRDHSMPSSISNPSSGTDLYWNWFIRYFGVRETLLGFAYWRLDGTYSTSNRSRYGDVERFGLLNLEWSDYANVNHLKSVQQFIRN